MLPSIIDKFKVISDLCEANKHLPFPDKRRIATTLKQAHIPFQTISFKTYADYFEPYRLNEKVVIIPLRPDKKGIVRNCVVCYTV